VHHAQNAEYIDANYGGVFILWDRIFGTYIAERTDLKTIYGTVKPLRSWNPIWSNFEIYFQMIRDSYYTKNLGDKIKVWFSDTRWRPEDVTQRFPTKTNDLSEFEKYDPEVSKTTKIFTTTQFVINSIISTVIIFTIEDQTYSQTALLAATLIASTTLVNLVLENAKKSYEIELVFTVVVLAMIFFEALNPSLLATQIFFYQSVFNILYIAIYMPLNKRFLTAS